MNDATVGAKNNWSISASSASKIYNGAALQSGKEKWCVTCHDESATASVISGVTAPNIAGDEDDTSYTYGNTSGTGWGFYKTGHGLPASSTYPESGGVVAGAGKECLNCHLSTVDHIDGLARTFDDDNSTSDQSSEYRLGYRLQQVGGQEPMQMPMTIDTINNTYYRLCMQTGCHPDDGTGPFLDGSNLNTNMRNGSTNLHNYHLDFNNQLYGPDWDFGGNVSQPTCVTCHNVHGSKRLVMLRDGTLTGVDKGFEIWYYNSSIVDSGNPPNPDDLPLSASTGTIYQRNTPNDFCAASCHSTNIRITSRTPFQVITQAPTLEWTGETNYTSDGVNPDSAGSGSNFVFRVTYTDTNNDAPSSIQVWVDRNDDGDYLDTNEKQAMTLVGGDSDYTNGELYTKSITLSYAGDGSYNYHFYASDGTADATGSPASDSTVTVQSTANNPPVLEWTVATCLTDGVKPAEGLATGNFEFKINYTDLDAGDGCPTSDTSAIQVWLDEDDDATYQADEKFNLLEDDASDTDCTDGKIYKVTRQPGYAGDGVYNYRFYATDGTDTAVGDPVTTGGTVTVLSTTGRLGVRSGSETGPVWFGSIQDAIDEVNGTNTVLVYEGTYEEATYVYFNGSNDNNTTLKSVCGADSTIITNSGRVVYFLSNTGSTLDGFTVTGGTTGIMLNGGSPTITNCKIQSISGRGIDTGNSGSTLTLTNSEVYSNTGRGIYINGGSGHTITDSTIRDNSTTEYGGGLYTSGTTTFTDTTIKNNTSTNSGGGVYVNGAPQEFYRCTITGNVSSSRSGAIDLGNSGATAYLENTIVADNQAPYAGAVYLNGGTFTAINSTIANNEATSSTAGAIYSNSGTITVRNSILWNNYAATSGHIVYFNWGSMTISDSIISNDGDGIYTDGPYFDGTASPTVSGYTSEDDPLFVNESGSDYHIQAASNAIDNASATYAPSVDIDNESRPQGSANDIGADEYTSASDNNTPVLTWTGETNYASDGVNPNSAAGESSFVFRITYTDADNTAPTSMQLWIDEDDSGTYESGEKYDMTAAYYDTVYTDGRIYTKTLTLSFAGDTNLNYRFYASDGTVDATGDPTSDSTVTVTNNVPDLDWTGEANYTTDGVNPNYNTSGSNYEFRVKYTDVDNTAPNYIEVWVDEDDSAAYSAGEKYAMTIDGGDSDYTNGENYTKTLAISYAGDGTLKYTFRSSDGTNDATGNATTDSNLVVANVPVLNWTGETNFESDGVNPDIGETGSSFEFRVKYTDGGNTAPTSIQVWVDTNDDGDYLDTNEKQDMTIVAGGDGDYTNGELFTKSMNISDAGDGVLNYRFYATNGVDDAIGDPASNNTLAINYAPTLAWTGETNYTADGVDPDMAVSGSNFTFRAKYTDADNDAPTSIQVWVDEDDDSTYQSDEKFDMTATDGGDSDYTDGKRYTYTKAISSAGDDTISYRFYASDGTEDATGDPATGGSISIISTLTVPGQYTTIQAAINAASTGDTVQVSDGTYDENIDFIGKDITVVSVNGAGSTTIQGAAGNNDAVVSFENGEGSGAVLDGFTINNQASNSLTRGVYISGATPTIQNSVIEGNAPISNNGGGVYINNSAPSFDNVMIRSNTAANRSGCGMYIEGAAGGATITNSTIGGSGTPNNCTNGSGGGIYYTGSSTGTLSISDSAISYNQSSNRAGGLYLTNITNTVTLTDTVIDNNSSINEGGGIYMSGASTTLTISGSSSSISSNTGRGGTGIYANATGAVSITDATIDNNVGTGNGGGIYMVNTTGSSSITNTSISSNQSTGQGAGLYFSSSATTSLTITNTNVDSNVNNNTGSYDGGGMYLKGVNVTVTITGGTINNNTTRGGAGIHALGGLNLTIEGTTINSNNADSNGGGINIGGTVDYPSVLDISSCVVSGNVADDSGGGILISSYVNATITNCTITGNLTSDNFDGGGIYDGGTATIYSSTIAGNYAHRRGGGLYANATTVVENSIIWGNNAGTSNPQIYGTPSSITYTDVEGGFAGTGNIDSDPIFVNEQAATSTTSTTSGDFHINSLVSPVVDTADATNSPADDIDGDTRPDGAADDMGSDEYLQPAQAAPVLDWTGETNYVSDGVDPQSAAGGSNFTFRVKYTDVNNDSPTTIQVWVDRNDDGDYLDTNEKENLTETDAGDTNKTDGKLYSAALAVNLVADNSVSYLFYAVDDDGTATGTPTSALTFTVTNNAPTVSWTGETNYTADGVDPNSGADGGTYTFRIKYTDDDAVDGCPASGGSNIQVWVDRNDDGDYLDASEKENMTEVSAGDTVCTDGKLYTRDLVLNTAGDTMLYYRFYASDGTDAAASDADPVSDANNLVTVGGTNNAPVLDWTGETNYTSDGVDPQSAAGGSTYTFRVKYTDADDEAPLSIQVWIDENDDSSYAAGEKYTMTAVDAGDTVYTDGKLYTYGRAISYAGDGTLNYRFYATDAQSAPATANAPVTGATFTVVDACDVPVEYGTIQAAINANSTPGTCDIVNVAAGSYAENIDFGGYNITVQSASGAGSTTITGTGANDAVVSFETGETSSAILDGFTIDNSGNSSMTRGILISGATPLIKNSIITGNGAANAGFDSSTNCYGGGGVCIYNSVPTFDNVTIKSNSAANRNGCGMYIQGAGGGATITNSTIGVSGSSNNCSNGKAGGIYANNAPISITGGSISNNAGGVNRGGGGIYSTGTGGISISGTTMNSNTGGSLGGGAIYMTGVTAASPLTISNSTINSNSTTSGGGAGIFLSGVTNTTTITDTTVNSNTGGSNSYGNGFYAYNAAVTISDGTFNSNTGGANRGGGGLYIAGDGALTNSITGTTINSNETGSVGGGGIYVNLTHATTKTLTLDKVKVQGNKATSGGGGGIRIASGDVTISNSLITGNSVVTAWQYAGGIYNQGTLNLYYSTIANNYGYRSGGLDCGGIDTIRNNIVYNNVAGWASGVDEIGGSCDTNVNNVTTDPTFVTPGTQTTSTTAYTDGDFRLSTGSNSVDTGDANNTSDHDILGNSRPVDLTGYSDGTNEHDIGAYEMQSLPLP